MKKLAGTSLAALLLAMSVASAGADQTFSVTSCLTGQQTTTIIEEGRSSVPTAPMVTWEEQRANTATWGDRRENAVSCPSPTITTPPANPSASPGPIRPTQPPEQPEESNDGHYIPASPTSQEQQMINSVNQERISRGLGALPVDSELTALARAKSADMVENRYFAHESPTYGKAAQMLKDAGYTFTSVGENIARSGSVEKAHAALMSSTDHRRNILGAQWTRMAIGIVNDANGFPYITQLFAR